MKAHIELSGLPNDYTKEKVLDNFINKDRVGDVKKVRLGKTPTKCRNSGFQWERDFAKKLSLWWTQGEDQYVFSPRSASGGSRRDREGLSSAAGDIHYDKDIGKPLLDKFVFELKSYRDLDREITKFVFGERSLITEFLNQVDESALPYDRDYFLIMKIPNRKVYCLTNCDIPKQAKYIESNNYKLSCITLDSIFQFVPNQLLHLRRFD